MEDDNTVYKPLETQVPDPVESLEVSEGSQPLTAFASIPSHPEYALESSLEVHQETPLSSSEARHSVKGFNKRKAVTVSAIITILVVLFTGAMALVLGKNSPKTDPGKVASTIPVQEVGIQDTSKAALPFELQGAKEALFVTTDIITRGGLKFSNNSFVTVLKPADLTSNQTFTIPDASGTLCLDSNNCGYATQNDIATLQAQLGQVVVPAVPASSLVNNQTGAVSIQWTGNQVSVTTSNGTITLSTPQDLASTSSPTFSSLLLSGNLTVNGFIDLPLNCTTFLNGGALTTNASGQIICSDDDMSGAGTNVTTPGGTVGTIPVFIAGDQIDDSLLSQALGTVTIAGHLNIGANNIVTAATTISSVELDVLDGGISEGEVSGSITDVTAGNGLTGGAASGNATLNVVSANGGIVVNANDITLTIQADKGLEVDANGLSLVDCGLNQILKYNGSNQWACAADAAGSGAPDSEPFVTVGNTANLSGERAINPTGNLTSTDNGANGTFDINTVQNPTFTTSITTPLLQSSGALSITPGGALIVGATTQTALLQGSTTTITSTGVGNDIVLTPADRVRISTLDCTGFANGGVLTTDASGNISCADDNGDAANGVTGSGTANRIALFTGAQTVADSWLLQNGSTLELDNTRSLSLTGGNFSVTGTGLFSGLVTANGGLTIEAGDTFTFNGDAFTDLTGTGLTISTGSLQTTLGTSVDLASAEVTGVLPVANGGTGVNGSGAANGQLLIGNGTGYSLATITQGSGITITNGAGSITVASTLGTSIESGEITDLTIVNGDIADGTIDISTKTTGDFVATIAGSSQVSVSGSGSNNAAVTLGIVADSIGDGQLAFNTGQHLTTTSSPTFASLILDDGTANEGTLVIDTLSNDRTYTFPDDDGEVCLVEAGNCAGSGNGITGSGTQNRLTKFGVGGDNILDSTITDDGSTVTTTVDLAVQGGGLSVGTALQDAALTLYGNGFAATIDSTLITGAQTYNLPDGSGEFCIKELGNCSGAGGGNAPNDAEYLVLSLNGGLSAERTLSFNGTNFSVVDNGANNSYTVNTAQNINSTASPTFGGLTLNGNIVLGANTIQGTTAIIDFTNFDVASNGNVTAGTYNGQTISNAASFTGSLTVTGLTTLNGGLTVEAGDTITFNGDAFTDFTGNGLQVTSNALTILVQANKGLEVDSNGLSLIDCSTGEVLKYNGSNQWACAADGTGADGDSVSVNSTAATDANFIDTAADGDTASVTWTINNVANPDEISIEVGVASDTEAGVVTTGAQTFAGVKTFTGEIIAEGNALINDTLAVGNDADPANTGQLLYSGSTFDSRLAIENTYTNLAATDYAANIINYTLLNPAADATATYYGIDNEVITEATNSNDFSDIYGSYDFVSHGGSGSAGNLYGQYGWASNDGAGTAGNIYGGYFSARNYGTGAVGDIIAGNFYAVNDNPTGNSDSRAVRGFAETTDGLTTILRGASFQIAVGGAGSVTTGYGLKIDSANDTSTGTIARLAGISVEEQTVGQSANINLLLGHSGLPAVGNYSIYNNSAMNNYFAGSLGLGDTSPQATLHVDGTVRFEDFTTCTALETDVDGDLVCGIDTDTTYSAGNDLDLSGTTFNIESQLDFVATINQTGADLTLQTTTSGNIVLNSAGTIELQDNTTVTGTLTVTSTAAVQGSSFTIGAAATQGNLVINDGDGETVTVTIDDVVANSTLKIPDTVGVNDTFCFLTLGNCAGSGGGITGSGANGQVAYFNGTGTITSDADFLFDGTDVTLGGDLAVNGGDITSTGVLAIRSATTNAITIDSGTTGAVNVGTGANAKTVTIGSTTGAAYTMIQGGVSPGGIYDGRIWIGNPLVNQEVLVGSATTTSRTAISAGTGGLDIGNNGIANTIQLGNSSGAVAQNINIGNNATASSSTVLTMGSSVGASSVLLQSGTGDVAIQSQDDISIGTNAVAQDISIGNTTGATSLTLNAGTGDVAILSQDLIMIGTNAVAQGILIGNTTGTTAVAVSCGTGACNFGADGTGAHSTTLGSTVTTSSTTLQSGSGDLLLTSTDDINIGTNAVAQDITIGNATGATSISIQSGTGSILIGTGAQARTVTIANGAAAQTVTLGSTNTTSSLLLQSGTGDVAIQSQDDINIGTNAVAQDIVIGNSTGATSVAVNCGTGACNFGTNAVAHTTTIGSITGAATTTVRGGTGGINLGNDGIANTIQIGNASAAVSQTINIGNNVFAPANDINIGTNLGAASLDLLAGTGNFTLNGAGATTYDIGLSTTGGTISVGGSSQTGTITIGRSGSSQSIYLGSGTAASDIYVGANADHQVHIASYQSGGLVSIGNQMTTGTITIGGGVPSMTGAINIGTSNGAQVVNVASGSGAKTVTLGSATGTASMLIRSGTGDVAIQSQDDINIGTNAVAQDIVIGNSTGATSVAVNCGTGACNFGTNAVAHAVTIGNATGASSLTLYSGTGDMLIESTDLLSLVSAATTTISATNASLDTTGNLVLGGALVVAGGAAGNLYDIGTSLASGNSTTLRVSSGSAGAFNTTGNSGNVIFQSGAALGSSSGDSGTVTLTTGHTGGGGGTGSAGAITIQPGNSTVASGTGALVTIRGGNQTGTTSTGGSVTIDAGTGTSTNGNVTIGGTNALAVNLGNTTGSSAVNLQAGSGGVNVTSGTLTVGTATTQGNYVMHDGDSETVTITIDDVATSTTIKIPDAVSTSDTFCLLTLANCAGAATDLQSAYEAGNTILATDAEGDVDIELSEATNFIANITGTGSFLVQDGGVDVLEIDGSGGITITGHVLPSSDDTYDLGSSSNRWRDLYLGPGTLHIGANADEATLGFNTGTDTLSVTSANVSFTGSISVAAGQSLSLAGGNTASRPASPTEGMLYFDTDTDTLLAYANGKWQATTGEYVIVAASNSSQAIKDAAHYVADGDGGGAGDGDQVQINAALTAASGGKVYLAPGTYVADATILIPNNTTLAGAGRGTLIELADLDAAENLIENSDTSTGTGVTIRDLRLDGRKDLNTVGTQKGIFLNGLGSGSGSTTLNGAIVSNIGIYNFRTAGLQLNTANNSMVTNSVFQANTTAGIEMTDGSNNTFTGNSMISNGSYGIRIENGSNTYTGNIAEGNGTGFYVIPDSGSRITMTGNIARNNTSIGFTVSTSTGASVDFTGNTAASNTSHGLMITYAENSNFSGNIVQDNGTRGIYAYTENSLISNNKVHNNGGATANNGIYLDGANNTTVSGNDISDTSCTTTCYAIHITAASGVIYLSDNYLGGNGTINDLGSDTIYGGQLNGSGNYVIEAQSGSIELQSSTNVTGNLDVSGTLAVGSSDQFQVDVSGNISTTGTSQFTGIATFGKSTGTAAVIRLERGNGEYNVIQQTGTTLDIHGSMGGGNVQIRGETGTGIYVSSVSNVGIGDTTPDAKLDVETTASEVTTTSYAARIENLQTNTTTNAIDKYGLYINSTGSFTGAAGTATNNYGLYVATPTGADNNVAAVFQGDVGINTTNPGESLTVAGGIRTQVSSSNYATLQKSSAQNLSEDLRLRVTGTNGTGYFIFTDDGKLSINNDGDEQPEARLEVIKTGTVDLFNISSAHGQDGNYFKITDTGEVGIGDTTPAATLTVGNGDLFQVAGATGNVLTAGTGTFSGATVTVGATALQGSYIMHDGDGETVTITIDDIAGSSTIKIPDTAGVADTFCLVTLANCSGSATTLQASYDADANGSDAVIGLSSTDGAVIIRDNATPLGTTLFAVQNSAGTTNYLNVTSSGIRTVDGSVGTPSYSFSSDTDTGLYTDGSDSNILRVSAGGNLKLTIDGTSTGGLTYHGGASVNASGLTIERGRDDDANSMLNLVNTSNSTNLTVADMNFLFTQSGSSTTTRAARILVGEEVDWTSTSSTQDSYLSFQTALNGTITERLRVSSAGVTTITGTITVPGSGGSSEQFGASASATGGNSLAVGNAASSAGNNNIAIGQSASNAGGNDSVALGKSATTGSAQYGVALGASASSTGRYGVSLGYGTLTDDDGQVAIGYTANSTLGTQAVAIGFQAVAGHSGIAVGGSASTSTFSNSIALGNGATNTANNQLVVSSGSSGISDAYFGNGVTAASPVNFTLNATGGSGTDIAGANIAIASGRGTGSAAGGDILFRTSAAGSSGTTLRNLSTKMIIQGSTGNVGIGSGVSSPDTMLHLVHDLGNAVIRLERNDASIDADNVYGAIEFEGQDASAPGVRAKIQAEAYDATSSARLVFYTADRNAVSATERLRIDHEGNVSIGTAANGTARLDVVTVDNTLNNANYVGQFVNNDATSGQSFGLHIQAGNNSSDTTLLVESRTGTDFLSIQGNGDAAFDTSTLFIDATSNEVGIGTAAPARTLEVSGGDNVARFTSSGSNAFIELKNSGSGSNISSISSTGDDLGFWTSGNKQLAISSTGVATFTNIIRTADGASGTPAYSFSSATASGLYFESNRVILKHDNGLSLAANDVRVSGSLNGGETALVVRNGFTAGSSIDETAVLTFEHGTDTGVKLIAGKESDYQSAAGRDSYFAIQTNLDGTVNEKLRITAAGNLSIGGDTTPDFKTEILGSSGSGYFGVSNAGDGDILNVSSTGVLKVATVASENLSGAKLFVNGGAEITGALRVGDTTNGFSFNDQVANKLRLRGTARNDRTIYLSPEFEGLTLNADGSNNTGVLNAGFCSGTSVLSVNTSVCAASDEHSFYEWTTSEGSAQDYDMYIRYKLPADFDGFVDDNSIKLFGRTTDTGDSTVILSIFEGATQCGSNTTINSSNNTWQETNLTGNETGCSFVAGDIMTIKIKVTAGSSDTVRVGAFTLNYKSSF